MGTFPDIIHVPLSDTIFVCLINTGSGIPFISALELRPLIWLAIRHWHLKSYGLISTLLNWVPINTSSVINTQDSNDSYQLPAQVLRTAVQPPSGHNALTYVSSYGTNNPCNGDKYYVCFHFAEIAKPTQGKKREFIIDVEGGNYTSEPITLEYLKPLSICPQNGQPFEGHFSFSINATMESGLPPIVNAIEYYSVISLPYKPTDPKDVAAIMYIKQTYTISRDDWQGDPCVPHQYSWSNLTCSSDDTPRIISLYLSSSKLTGKIATSISDLTALQYLDLSYNNLTGNVPEFLAQLPNLKILFGPEALIQKSRDGSLVLRLELNVVLVATSIIILIILFIFCALAIHKRRRRETAKESNIKSKNRQYSYPEVVEITNSFQTIVGEGGFGKVYLGILKDETKVAIKLLSPSSKQGYKEFQAEALIYEYMANGNLQQHLSVTNMNVLTWNQRLHIAVDAAHAENDTHVSSRPAGTLGYLNPEFQKFGNFNKKTDIYSYGIVLFELITSRPAIIRGPEGNTHIVDWVHPIIESGDIRNIIDPRLHGQFDINSAWKAVEIAMSCIAPATIQRSDMSEVCAELKECLALEMAHGRSQRMVTGGNKTISNNQLITTSLELESDIVALAR
ncbi:putative lrr receptor-like serine/threonine-protein kinase [Quercus suber]|uniref:Lrr receptor-like serine/threonine-protein kinase n=1 Tax=Quercus suber TaxID=58331 RepID=A0AAW0ISC8_QUESU